VAGEAAVLARKRGVAASSADVVVAGRPLAAAGFAHDEAVVVAWSMAGHEHDPRVAE
jgi:hypothetical protein